MDRKQCFSICEGKRKGIICRIIYYEANRTKDTKGIRYNNNKHHKKCKVEIVSNVYTIGVI